MYSHEDTRGAWLHDCMVAWVSPKALTKSPKSTDFSHLLYFHPCMHPCNHAITHFTRLTPSKEEPLVSLCLGGKIVLWQKFVATGN